MKKLVCAGLAAVCLMLAGGCGGKDAEAPDTKDEEQPTNAEVSEPEPPPPDPAEVYVDGLTLEEQAAQMFFVRCPEEGAADLAGEYNIGGYILFGRDFEGETPERVKGNIASCQAAVKTPMLIGVDEEGGTVVRMSSNINFRREPFRSPRSLYDEGGMELVLSETAEKDAMLASVGINVNLAPVCDFSSDPDDFMYPRTCCDTPENTADYVRGVVDQMLEDNTGMVLKHFPGYGNNPDTHTGIATDDRPYEQFEDEDFLPFEAGIKAGAQAVLVSHNIVNCMDDELPASLSPKVHRILREELGFEGVVMTDDLIMEAITQYTEGADAAVLAVKAGNDMLISSDFQTQYDAVLAALESGELTEEQIREAAIRTIRWKMQLGLISGTDADSDMEPEEE